jgi:hypothetical protein
LVRDLGIVIDNSTVVELKTKERFDASNRDSHRYDVQRSALQTGRDGDRLLGALLRDGQPIAAEAGVIGAAQLVDALDRIAAEAPAAPGAR